MEVRGRTEQSLKEVRKREKETSDSRQKEKALRGRLAGSKNKTKEKRSKQ